MKCDKLDFKAFVLFQCPVNFLSFPINKDNRASPTIPKDPECFIVLSKENRFKQLWWDFIHVNYSLIKIHNLLEGVMRGKLAFCFCLRQISTPDLPRNLTGKEEIAWQGPSFIQQINTWSGVVYRWQWCSIPIPESWNNSLFGWNWNHKPLMPPTFSQIGPPLLNTNSEVSRHAIPI